MLLEPPDHDKYLAQKLKDIIYAYLYEGSEEVAVIVFRNFLACLDNDVVDILPNRLDFSLIRQTEENKTNVNLGLWLNYYPESSPLVSSEYSFDTQKAYLSQIIETINSMAGINIVMIVDDSGTYYLVLETDGRLTAGKVD